MAMRRIPFAILKNLVPPLAATSTFWNSFKILIRAKALWPTVVGSAALGAAQVSTVILMLDIETVILPLVIALCLATSLLALGLTAWRFYCGILRPLRLLEEKIERICQGDSKTPLRPEQIGGLSSLADAVQNLNDELVELYEDMDNRVDHQTWRLAQKTASLKILYESAVSINQVQDLSTLLTQNLRTFKEMVNGYAASVWLFTPNGHHNLLACIDSTNKIFLEHELKPIPLCLCGRALIPGEILCENSAKFCSRLLDRTIYNSKEIESLEVPLQCHSEVLGNYRIWVERGIAGREDMRELFTTIGRHLGVAIAKYRSDMEARRLSIMQERNNLAHELHDSLAQTLTGLRFRVHLLQETLSQTQNSTTALPEVQRISAALEQAHVELRDLLNNFRSHPDPDDLASALEKLVTKFKQETGTITFLQCDCPQVQLSSREITQMLRIIQEALTNIRKHAQAHTVRILLRCHPPGHYLLLVEDDGVGFVRTKNALDQSGNHLGLSVMQERASRIGAILRIESELGEGTRIELIFNPGQRPKANGN